MKKILIFGITTVIACVAIIMIFNIVFPEGIELMFWNMASGCLMLTTLLYQVILCTSSTKFTVKHASISSILSIVTIVFFVWTFIFTFLVGDYQDTGRNMDTYYIGNLIIIILFAILLFMSYGGGSVAEEHSDAVEAKVADKKATLLDIESMEISISNLDSDRRSPLRRSFAFMADQIKTIPLNKVNNMESINDSLAVLKNEIEEGNIESVKQQIELINNQIKRIKI